MKETEAQFQGYVIQLAEVYGWDVAHFAKCPGKNYTPAVGNIGRGFPDLLLVRDTEAMFVELKTNEGKVQPHQREVHRKLQIAGFRVEVWRPMDRDVLEKVLR
jgi:hypothetical protein